MENLEQTVEKSFWKRIKDGLGKIKNSAVSTAAVYSLAGILGAGGLGWGYGCRDAGMMRPGEKDTAGETGKADLLQEARGEGQISFLDIDEGLDVTGLTNADLSLDGGDSLDVREEEETGIQQCRKREGKPFLQTEGQWIKDEQGRIVILRGAVVVGMEFGWFEHEEEAFKQIKEWGFNIVRTPMSWSFIEPSPGVYDETYLYHLDQIIDRCKKYGLYITFGLHQCCWSAHFAGNCLCGNGAPEWTCSQYPQTFEGMMQAAGDFWKDEELKEHFYNAWKFIAQRYADEPAVAGYYLFNEPNPGTAWTEEGKFEEEYLLPFYHKLIAEIRTIDPHHIVFMDPHVLRIIGVPFHAHKMDEPNVIYTPHLYRGDLLTPAGSCTDYDGNPQIVQEDYAMAKEEADILGTPFWNGEFATNIQCAKADLLARDYLIEQDKYMSGGVWWAYWKDSTQGLLYPDGTEKTPFLDVLSRTYPQYIAGTPKQFSFDIKTKIFQMTWEDDPCVEGPTVVYVPAARHYPDGFTISSSNPDINWKRDKASGLVTIWTNGPESSQSIKIAP